MTLTNFHFIRPVCYCFGVAVTVCSIYGEGEEEERTPTEWVQAMNKAQAELSFEGELYFWNGIDINRIEYSQHFVDGEVQVKAKPIRGPKREITRTDKALSISFSPDDDLREVGTRLTGNSLSRLFPPDVATLSESYNIASLPNQEIADRSAVGVSIMPKQKDRHGFNVWIDEETALLLRMEMCDCDTGRKIKVLVFTELTVLEGSLPKAADTEESEESDLSVNIVNEDESEASRAKADWEPGVIPDGFKLSGTKTQNGVLLNRTYSDGMNAFTIQIRPAPRANNADVQLQMMIGPTVIVQKSAADAHGRPQIVTVVGDLPRRTIWKIADGVKFER